MIPSSTPFDAMLKRLTANPAIADNPQAQNLIRVLRNGDTAEGEQIANNIIDTYGTTREEALAQAKRFFHIA